MAAEFDAIKDTPLIPNFSVTDNPRVTFEENEYKEFLSSIKKCIKKGDVVRGHKITNEFNYFVCIIVHSYLCSTDREAFALKHKDISPNDDGTINLRVTKGKTGFRHSFSTELGLDFYNQLRKFNNDYARPNNFLFLPKMENRTHANRTFQRIDRGWVVSHPFSAACIFFISFPLETDFFFCKFRIEFGMNNRKKSDEFK